MNTSPVISLIIPVYNKEKYLTKCLTSIEQQDIDKKELEVILVNDGSTDGSRKLCEKFAANKPHISLINKENGGVSSARNVGIAAARGKYIAFLDADDSLTQGSLKALANTFAKFEDEIDVLTYHMAYHHVDTKEIIYHKRDKYLKETGVYKLQDYPYICQTTMNIVVKSKIAKQVLFDESMKQGEDQQFITHCLLDKRAIGYCAEAEYCYTRSGDGASSLHNWPIYAYEDMMRLYEFFIQVADKNLQMAEYTRQMLLHNISWRLKSNMLFPYHLTGKEFDEQNARLSNILQQVPAKSYGESPYLTKWYKAYFMKHYGCIESDSEISIEGKKASVTFPSQNYVWKTTAPTVEVLRLIQCESCFKVLVRFGCPLFYLGASAQLEVRIGGTWHQLDLGPCSYDYRNSHEKTAKFYIASFEISFNSLGLDSTVAFRAFCSNGELKGLKVLLNENLMAIRSNCSIVNEEWVFASYRVKTKGKKSLAFAPLTFMAKIKHGSNMGRCSKGLLELRKRSKKALKKFKGKEVWVYADLPTSPNAGNALFQFIHDIACDDGIKRYYVTNCAQNLLHKYPQLEGHILACNSSEHKSAMLAASTLLTSYKEEWIFYPFEQQEWFSVGDLACEKKIVYLQHGVLHAHLPWYLSFDRTLFDYIVVSTSYEEKILQEKYVYPPQSIIKTGAPRLDLLDGTVANKKKKVALIFSWRTTFIKGSSPNQVPNYELFLASTFYKGFLKFIEAINKLDILGKYGYEMDIKLHPNFSCFEQYFKVDAPHINIIFDDIKESEYALAITDFSSYIYDFIYAGARVMYFLPDEIEFRAGLNHYSELEIPLGIFGPYTTQASDAAAIFKDILASIESGEISPYQEKIDSFFVYHDTQNRHRLYGKL